MRKLTIIFGQEREEEEEEVGNEQQASQLDRTMKKIYFSFGSSIKCYIKINRNKDPG